MPKVKLGFTQLISAVYLAVLFVLPLLFNPWGFDIYEVPKNIFFACFVSLLGIGVSGVLLSKKRGTFTLSKKQTLILSLFVGTLGLSLLASLRPEISFFGTYYRQGGVLNFLSYSAVFLLGIFYFDPTFNKNPQREKLFFKTVLASGLLVSFYAILQKAGIDIYESISTDVFAGRSFSTLGNPTSLGTYLLFPLGATLALAITEKKHRAGYFLACVPLLLALAFSQSRGAMLAVMLSSGLMFLTLFKSNKKAMIGIFSGGALAIIAFALFFSSNTRSLNSRFTIWESSVEVIKEAPLFGIGLENFSYAFEAHVGEEFFQYEDYRDLVDRPHNEFLEVWIHLGLAGLLLYLAYIAYLLRTIWISGDPLRRLAGLTLFSLVLANFFGFSLVTQSVFATAFLSFIAVQNKEKITWKWTLSKNALAFIGIFLLLINCFLHLRLLGVDWSLKKAYVATLKGDAELMTEELYRATQWGAFYGEVFNKSFTYNLALAKTYQADFFLQQAVAMNEQAKELQMNTLLNRLNEASLYELVTNYEGAEAIYLKASEELAPNPVLFQNWAELYYIQGRYEEALPLYEAFLNLLPDWSASEDAKRIFWKNHPDFEDVFAHILSTYENLGKMEEAFDLEEKLK